MTGKERETVNVAEVAVKIKKGGGGAADLLEEDAVVVLSGILISILI